MPKGPKDQKRPADVIGNAVKVMKIATGEELDATEGDGKDPAAKAMGKKGGEARAEKLSPEKRSEIARNAAKKRWERVKRTQDDDGESSEKKGRAKIPSPDA